MCGWYCICWSKAQKAKDQFTLETFTKLKPVSSVLSIFRRGMLWILSSSSLASFSSHAFWSARSPLRIASCNHASSRQTMAESNAHWGYWCSKQISAGWRMQATQANTWTKARSRPEPKQIHDKAQIPKHNALHSLLEASHLACSSSILVWRSQGWCLLSSNGCDEQGFLSQMATYRWCASSQRQWMALRFKMAIPSVLDMVPMAGRIINQKSLWDTTKSASVRLSSGSASGL